MALKKDDFNATNVDITGGLVDAPLGTRSAQPVVASPLISRDAAYLGSYTVIDGKLIIAYLQGLLPSAMANDDTSYDFQREMTVGDFILMRWGGQFEYITVGALSSGTTYAITRDSTSEDWGALDWPQNQPYIVLGQEGAGRLELSAEGGEPRLRIIKQGATAAAETTLGVLGELNGNYGITSSTIGLGLGVSNGTAAPTGAVLTVDPTNGLRISTPDGDFIINEHGLKMDNGAWMLGYDGGTSPSAISWMDDTYGVIGSIACGWDGSEDLMQILVNGDASGHTTRLELNADLVYPSNNFRVPSGKLQSYANSTAYTGYIYVSLAANLTSTAWDGDARSTTTWTKIDLSAVFSAPAGIKAAKLRLFARDSATLGTVGLYFDVGPNGSAVSFSVRPIGGDVWAETVGDCPCNADGDIYYRLNASGSSTMDVYIEIMGYYI